MRAHRALLVCLPFIVFGCGSEKPKPESVYLFLFDASGSCIALRDQFLRDFRNKIMSIEGARVYVDVITAANVPTYPIAFDVPRRKGALAEYSDSYDRARTELADTYDAEIQALFREQDEKEKSLQSQKPGTAGGTDVILTLSLVTLFERDEVRDIAHKELLVFSDGVQQSPDLDLTSKSLNLENLTQAVDRLEPLGLIPRLQGVTVKIGGLAAGKGKQLSAAQVVLIRRFWASYFEKSGARFNAANLDGSIMN